VQGNLCQPSSRGTRSRADQIRSRRRGEGTHCGGLRPGLAVVSWAQSGVGDLRPQQGEELRAVGHLQREHTPADSVTTENSGPGRDLNRRDEIDGILVQCRCPAGGRQEVLLAVSPEKDVDGFHPMNVGYLSTQRPGLVPCTPAASWKS